MREYTEQERLELGIEIVAATKQIPLPHDEIVELNTVVADCDTSVRVHFIFVADAAIKWMADREKKRFIPMQLIEKAIGGGLYRHPVDKVEFGGEVFDVGEVKAAAFDYVCDPMFRAEIHQEIVDTNFRGIFNAPNVARILRRVLYPTDMAAW